MDKLGLNLLKVANEKYKEKQIEGVYCGTKNKKVLAYINNKLDICKFYTKRTQE